jgi:hypothetical protein
MFREGKLGSGSFVVAAAGGFVAGLPVAFQEVAEGQSSAAHHFHLLAPDLQQFLLADEFPVNLRSRFGHSLLSLAELPQVVVDEPSALLPLLPLQEGQSILEAQLLQLSFSLLVILDVADVSEFGVDGWSAAGGLAQQRQ